MSAATAHPFLGHVQPQSRAQLKSFPEDKMWRAGGGATLRSTSHGDFDAYRLLNRSVARNDEQVMKKAKASSLERKARTESRSGWPLSDGDKSHSTESAVNRERRCVEERLSLALFPIFNVIEGKVNFELAQKI